MTDHRKVDLTKNLAAIVLSMAMLGMVSLPAAASALPDDSSTALVTLSESQPGADTAADTE